MNSPGPGANEQQQVESLPGVRQQQPSPLPRIGDHSGQSARPHLLRIRGFGRMKRTQKSLTR